ncbi:MAG: discoidin domain-containing protein, partial [Victivallales bacterium]|nr:discoidin domain-containing protein [Victivallales bacterium]
MRKNIGLLVCAAFAAFSQNLVKNGGFDGDEAWKALDGNKMAWSFVNMDGVSKATSMRIAMDHHHKASDMAQRVACKSGHAYSLRAALKGDGAIPKVTARMADGTVLAEVKALEKDAKTWKYSVKSFKTPDGCGELDVVVSMDVTADNGGVLAAVDDISVTEGVFAEESGASVGFVSLSADENLALHKPYTMKPSPSYSLCTDENDRIQLTDGVFTEGYFWAQKSTVGWMDTNVVSVTVDLGRVEPIRGFMLSMAGGVAGVTFPDIVYVYASDDNKEWRIIGNLVEKSVPESGEPKHDEYNTFKFGTTSMPAKGRYVTFLVCGKMYTFIDEIEIYKGDASLLAENDLGKPVKSPQSHFSNLRIVARLEDDVKLLEKAAKECSLDISDELKAIKHKAITGEYGNMDDMVTIIPICDVQRDIFALNSRLLRAKGFAKPQLWSSCRWDNLQPMDVPPSKAKASFTCEMMRNEVRAETFNVLNPTDSSIVYNVKVTGFPEAARVDLREVLFTDTKQLKCVSGALKPGNGTSLAVEVPAGTSRQIWLSFNRPSLKAGRYKGKATLTPDGKGLKTLALDLELVVRDVDFPERPRLHLGGWDYVEDGANYYRAPGNIQSNLAMMRSIYVDSPWANPKIQPTGAKFNEAGNLVNAEELDYTMWDNWVKLWVGARIYCVFMAVGNSFGGEPMGTARFNTMVGDYYKAFVAHAEAQGIKASQLLFLIYDEPYSQEADRIIIAWAKAMKPAVPDVNLFIDPIYRDPTKGLAELYDVNDIICPNTVFLIEGGKPFKDFYMKYKEAGKKMALYSCSGPARLLDPIRYHRAQMWRAFEFDAFICGYWAFGCGGGIGDSWASYTQSGTEYSPYFVSQTDTMDAKQSAGVQEGMQDFEILCMLRDRISEFKKAGKDVSAAQKLLDGAVERALAV